MRATILLILCFLRASAANFYVSTNGSSSGSGTIGSPWDFGTALGDNASEASSNAVVSAGDTIWLAGGTYYGPFTSYLTGSPSSQIRVRPNPGHHVKVDGTNSPGSHVVLVLGGYVDFMDLEVTISNTNRVEARGAGFYILAPGTRVIDSIVHNCGNGISTWTEAPDCEVSGCIIYHGGWQGADPDRGHGHGMYVQNNTGVKTITGNIIFSQFGKGIQAYTESGFLRAINVSSNIIFDSGSINRDGSQEDQILIGGLRPADEITVVKNVTYASYGGGTHLRLGYSSLATNGTAVVENNTFISGGSHSFQYWTNLTVRSNIFKNDALTWFILQHTNSTPVELYDWDANTYYSDGGFWVTGTNYTFSQWTNVFGHDLASSWSSESNASGSWTYVIPNKNTAGRANIAIVNWGLADNVDVNLSGVMNSGDGYEIRNAQDFFSGPVLNGTFSGSSISFPMTNLSLSAVIGSTNAQTVTWPKFNTFVLLSSAASVSGSATANSATVGRITVR